MTAPLIAINPLHEDDEPSLRLRTRYVDAVRRAGGLPVVLPTPLDDPASRDAELRAILARMDGVLLTGGDDFHTEPLGLGATHPAAQTTEGTKQAADLALTRLVLELDLPVLGICYGMQCLGLAGGATLHQDVPSALPAAQEHRGGAVHAVRPREGSKLARVLGVEPLPVVSRHHQALRTVPPPWIVSAMDDEMGEDGGPAPVIEAIERSDRRFALGVQWHPEIALPTEHAPRPDQGGTGAPGLELGDALLRALVEAAAAGHRS